MPDQRHILARRGQRLVAIPALIWRRLQLTPGRTVWWHLSGKEEAVLSVRDRRRGGRPNPADACPHCERREKELTQLRHQLIGGGAVDGRQYFDQGWMAALGKGLKIEAQYQLVSIRLAGIERRLAELRPRRPRPAQESRGAAQPRTSNPRPDPPPSGSSEGAATSGGAAPQVAQPDMTVQHL